MKEDEAFQKEKLDMQSEVILRLTAGDDINQEEQNHRPSDFSFQYEPQEYQEDVGNEEESDNIDVISKEKGEASKAIDSKTIVPSRPVQLDNEEVLRLTRNSRIDTSQQDDDIKSKNRREESASYELEKSNEFSQEQSKPSSTQPENPNQDVQRTRRIRPGAFAVPGINATTNQNEDGTTLEMTKEKPLLLMSKRLLIKQQVRMRM